MAELVDLSLFSSSPTYDGHFAINAEPDFGVPYRSAYLSTQAANTLKPLPPVSRRRAASQEPNSRPQLCYPSRMILHKMKRLRVDTTAGSEVDDETQPRSTPTLQQRRRRDQTNATPLTLPLASTHVYRPTGAAVRSQQQQPPPMIWLAEEQTWLIPENNDQQRELHGYYAPAPHSDPGPWQMGPPPRYTTDSPPSYTNSTGSPANSADYSPIRTQFLTLMEPRPSQQVQSATSEPPRWRSDFRGVSPFFQEALCGVGFGPVLTNERNAASGAPPMARRKESVQSEGFVSPLSPEGERRAMPWALPKAATSHI